MSRQLIRNATIVNGDGITPPYLGDILIDGERIVHLGAIPHSETKTAEHVVDAAGMALAPGFVDTHNHGALGGTQLGASGLPVSCELAIRGGVTRRICGVDGLSPAPVLAEQRSQYAAQLKPLDGAIGAEWTWSSVSEFVDWHRGRSVTDMGLYLGHSAVRRVVMHNLARVASDGEIAAMAAVVRREAPLTLGLSTGLVYNPAVYCDQREITALVRAFNEVKPGAIFPHLRSESDNIVASLKEVVEAAIDGGGGYCNEHSKIAGSKNYEKIGEVEAILADASSLIPTMENMYPYTAGSTTGDAIDGEDLTVRRAAVESLGPYNGTVVAVDPTTGRILTMVNQRVALRLLQKLGQRADIAGNGGRFNRLLLTGSQEPAIKGKREGALGGLHTRVKGGEGIDDHEALLAPGAEVHYVVGNSQFFGITVPVEKLYVDLFTAAGLVDAEARIVRKRSSKKGLFEFVVSARAPGTR